MSTQTPLADDNSPQTGGWIRPFGDSFIGLNREGVIRRVIGAITIPPELHILQIQGLTWSDFVRGFADPAAQPGLLQLWHAVVEGAVAPAFWPAIVPFAPGIVAHLRPVAGDPIVGFAVHLAPAPQSHLDHLISTTMQDSTYRLVGLSQSVFRGVHGPLTDSQVQSIGAIVSLSENLSQLLDSLRTEFTAPATTAPLPHDLQTLLAFSTKDFASIRRVVTHRLRLEIALPSQVMVYCYPALRDAVRHTLTVLLAGITAQTTIVLRGHDHPAERSLQLDLTYSSKEPALVSSERLEPAAWLATPPLKPATPLQQLVTALQSGLRPIGGRVWAEPSAQAPETMRMSLILPRWTVSPNP